MESISAKASPQSLMKSQEKLSGQARSMMGGNKPEGREVGGREPEKQIRSEFSEVFRSQSEKSADKNSDEESVSAQSPPTGREPESEELNSKRFQQRGVNANNSMTEREKAILKFMDSFESEFGVPPQRMVAAMAGLNQQESSLPPEQTADLVIEKLHLHDDEKEKAQAVYIGFLLQLNAMPSLSTRADTKDRIQDDFKPSQTGNLLKMSGVNQTDSLNAIQQRTATAAAAAAMAAAYAGDKATIEEVGLDSPSDLLEGDDASSLVGGSFGKDATLANVARLSISRELPGEAKVDAKKMDGKVEGKSTSENRSLETREMSPALIATGQLQGSDSEANENFSQQQQQSSERQEGQAGQAVQVTQEDQVPIPRGTQNHPMERDSAMQSMKGSSKTRLPNEGLGQKKVRIDELNFRQMAESLSGDRVGAQGQNDLGQNLSSSLPPLPGGGSELGSARPGSLDHEANIKEIMSQAQVLIKNGGGEMKVKMTPEGLGELQMKVSVIDGKVSVQMMTESREAKAAIESSLADLKTSLSAQKLSVEHMKIDVVGSSSENAKLGFGTNGGSHSESRPESGPGSNPNFQRDSTRQFWDQFQQSFGNRSQREGLFDVMPKGYTSRKPYEPLEAPAISTQRASLARGKGSELNLVA